jgi:hypothetical protein
MLGCAIICSLLQQLTKTHSASHMRQRLAVLCMCSSADCLHCKHVGAYAHALHCRGKVQSQLKTINLKFASAANCRCLLLCRVQVSNQHFFKRSALHRAVHARAVVPQHNVEGSTTAAATAAAAAATLLLPLLLTRAATAS